MRFFIKTFSFAFLIAAFSISQQAQSQPFTQAKINWSQNPFKAEAFIENNGQVTGPVGSADVKYVVTVSGVRVYFTPHGVTYGYDEYEESSEAEREGGKVEEEMGKPVSHFVQMEWVGANSASRIIPEDKVPYYFTYAGPEGEPGKSGIRSSAFKKIIYKDIYPGIDAEYVLPEKGGVKYDLVVHPGGNLSQVKMKYTGAQNIFLDKDGNVVIHSSFGLDYVEHAPQSFYSDNTPVTSSFLLNSKGLISFNAKYDVNKTLIIDPWMTIVPNFPNSDPGYAAYANRAYDVHYDDKGNVWVYGGGDPLGLRKYNSAGVLQWVYSQNFGFVGDFIIGDFDVDPKSGSAYLVEGLRIGGSKIQKVNAAGTPVATSAQKSQIEELSRVRLDCHTGKLYFSGGGVPASQWQIGVSDTTTMNLTGLHITSNTSGDHDACLMALDPTGTFIYINFNRPEKNNSNYLNDNEMQKRPMPAMSPSAWINPGPTFSFTEITSLRYPGPNASNTYYARLNMFNGMVCGNGFLYTYNGDTLKKWDKNTGNMLAQTKTGGKRYFSGGLELDLCENVYASVSNAVKVYDANLNLINTYPLTDTSCYDIKVNTDKNLLYACGVGYVREIAINPPAAFQYSVSSTPSSCGCDGTASMTVQSCNPASLTYSWIPGGQTTSTVTGLCPGNYSVTIGLGQSKCANHDTLFAVTVSGGAGTLSVTATVVPATCTGNNGSASVNVNGGTSPYTYSWSPSGGTSASATGLGGGTYTVTISDAAGCSNTQVVTINQPGAISSAASATATGCGINNGTATVNPSGGSTPYTFSWSPSGGSSATATGLAAGTYTVIITDAVGCTGTQTVSVTQVTSITATATSSSTACTVNNGTATVVPSGGTTPYTYSWSPSGGNSAMATGLGAGTYTVIITDANGCTGTQTVSVAQASSISSVASSTPAGCAINNGTATAAGNAGVPPYTYSWSPSGGTNATATGLAAGNYSATVTDANGCTSTSTVTVGTTGGPTANASANVTIIVGNSTVISASGGGTYLWSNGDSLASTNVAPTITTQYCVVVTDSNTCTDTACVTVFVMAEPIDCSPASSEDAFVLPSAFSPNADGENDKWKLLYAPVLADCIDKISIAVYNRWGEKIFESSNVNFVWDGTYKGKMEDTAVFGYYLEATLRGGKEIKKKGNVSLLR